MSEVILIASSDEEDDDDQKICEKDSKSDESSKPTKESYLKPENKSSNTAKVMQLSDSSNNIDECVRRKVQSLKQRLNHEKPSKVSHSGYSNIVRPCPKVIPKLPTSNLNINVSHIGAISKMTGSIRTSCAPTIPAGSKVPSVSSKTLTEHSPLATPSAVKLIPGLSSSVDKNNYLPAKSINSNNDYLSSNVEVTAASKILFDEIRTQSVHVSVQPPASVISPTTFSKAASPEKRNKTPIFKPNISQIIEKNLHSTSNLTTATTTTIRSATRLPIRKPQPDCIILDDSDNEEDTDDLTKKSVSNPKLRLEKVVGKLLTNSTGKQSLVHVSSTSSSVRLSMFDTSTTVSNASKTSIISKNSIYPSPQSQPCHSGVPSTSNDASSNSGKKVTKHMRIKVLQKKLETLERRINQHAAKEISLQDMGREESPYIQECRLKEEFIRTWKKYCRLTGDDADAVINSRKKMRVSSSPFPEINREVEKYVNRTGSFPNLFDIKSVCLQANNKFHLDIKPVDIQSISVDVFTEVGRKLQKNREKELRATSGNKFTDLALLEKDPALEDDNLKRKLKHNRKIAKKRTEDVFKDFVKQQYEQEGGNGPSNLIEEGGDTDDEYESLRKKDLIENKKLKKKLIQKKVNAPPAKKSKMSESKTVINVTLSSSQDEDLSKKKKIDCRVTFSASPEQHSTNKIQYPLTNPNENTHTLSSSPANKISKTVEYPTVGGSHSPLQIPKFPGFPTRSSDSNSQTTKPGSSTNNNSELKLESNSYDSPLKRFRNLNDQKTKMESASLSNVSPKKEPYTSVFYKTAKPSQKSEVVIIDSDDD